jgi:hypothetical protein
LPFRPARAVLLAFLKSKERAGPDQAKNRNCCSLFLWVSEIDPVPVGTVSDRPIDS